MDGRWLGWFMAVDRLLITDAEATDCWVGSGCWFGLLVGKWLAQVGVKVRTIDWLVALDAVAHEVMGWQFVVVGSW